MRTVAKKHKKISEYAESLQSEGKYWLIKNEAIRSLRITESAFNKAALRLIKQTKLMRIRNGFYVIIPVEFRQSKGLPPTYYIDALMKFSKQPYYVGVLSAAALHGASHQSPQELQVVTSKPLSKIETNSTRIRFITKKDMENTPTMQMKTQTGYMQVSTAAATVWDLLRYVRIAGHLDNVMTVISELLENIKVSELIKTADNEKDVSNVQRLGFLLENLGLNKNISRELHKLIKKKDSSFVFLRPDQRKGIVEKNTKWGVLVNTKVEVDI